MNSVFYTRRDGNWATECLLRAVLGLLLCGISGGVLAAEEEELASGNFVVSLLGEGGQRPWIVKALEQNIYNDLAGYSRVVAIEKSPTETTACPARDVACLLDHYNALNIDALMLGSVDRSDLEYQVYDVRNAYLVNSGSINIGASSSMLTLRLGAFQAFKIFIEKGGILDDRYEALPADEPSEEVESGQEQVGADTEPVVVTPEPTTAPARTYPPQLREWILQGLVVAAFLPLLLSLFGRPILHPDRSILLRKLYPFLIVSLTLIGYQYYLEMNGSGDMVTQFLELFAGTYWILAAIGGAIWGSFLIVNLQLVIPHLTGMERIEQKNLVPLLRACLLTMLIKAAFFSSFYAAVFLAVLEMGTIYGFGRDAAILLVFPVFGLFLFYWVALMLDVFAMSNDIKLAGRRLHLDNEWNEKVRHYFIAYLKRNGVTLDRKLVNSIRFLPGEHHGVVSYKGGFGKPRIAVEKKLLAFALGDIDESEPDESLNQFYEKRDEPDPLQRSVISLLGSQLQRAKDAKRRVFKTRSVKRLTRILQRLQPLYARELGANASNRGRATRDLALGTVLPALGRKDDTAPLMSNSARDVAVFREFLGEYTSRHAPLGQEAEVDDANEYDLDFLFGALLHKVGSILRHDTIFSTVKLYFSRKKKIQETGYRTILSKPFAIVADTFVVLNFAGNHLLQHLYYKLTEDGDHLTSKGLPGHMLANQAAILQIIKEVIERQKRPFFLTNETDRMTWLSQFTPEPLERDPVTAQRVAQFTQATFAAAIAGLAVWFAIDSYLYHPKYVEMIELEEQEIAEAIEKAQENKGSTSNE